MWYRLALVSCQHLSQGSSTEGSLSGNSGAEDGSNTVDVTQVRSFAACDFRCHIFDGLGRVSHIHLGEFTQHADVQKHAEVAQKHMSAFKQKDIAGLDVAVDDVQTVCISKRVAELAKKRQGVRGAQALSPG
jgi:hypothetical protein